MSDKAITPTKIPLDQIFVVPRGAEDAFTSTDGSSTIPSNGGRGTGIGGESSLIYAGTSADAVVALPSPNVFSVIDQQLRRTPTGEVFVDIVVDVEDIPGAVEYEISISRSIT